MYKIYILFLNVVNDLFYFRASTIYIIYTHISIHTAHQLERGYALNLNILFSAVQ